MKKIRIYLLVALLCGMSSCSDFLDRYPDTAVPEEESMTDLVSSEQIVIGIYSSFKNSALYSGTLTLAPDVQTDLVYAVKGYTNVYGPLYRWDFRDSDTSIESVYSGLYQVIARCNFFMDHKDEVYGKLTTEADKTTFKKYEGDVYFFRALAYSDLIRMYCEAYDPARADEQLGMPIVRTLDHERNMPRASLKATYEFMLEDLAEAEKRIVRSVDIYVVSYEQHNVASTQAVLALRARLYLYMQDYPKASDTALDCWNACTAGQMYLANTEDIYNLLLEDGNTSEVMMRLAMTPVDVQGSIGTYFCVSSAGKILPEYVPSTAFLEMFEAGDMRYNMFERVRTGYQHGLEWEVCLKSGHSTSLDKSSSQPAYQSMPALFRMSELALIIAEANAANPGGNMSLANEYMNKLKTARIESWKEKSFTATEMMKEIKEERAKELCLEGFRLADLKRWHMGILQKPQPYTNAPFNALEVKADDPRFTWPIPQHELDAPGVDLMPNESNK